MKTGGTFRFGENLLATIVRVYPAGSMNTVRAVYRQQHKWVKCDFDLVEGEWRVQECWPLTDSEYLSYRNS